MISNFPSSLFVRDFEMSYLTHIHGLVAVLKSCVGRKVSTPMMMLVGLVAR